MSSSENNLEDENNILDEIVTSYEIPKSYLNTGGFNDKTLDETFNNLKEMGKLTFKDGLITFKLKKEVDITDKDNGESLLKFESITFDPKLLESDKISTWRKEFAKIENTPNLIYKAVYSLIRMLDETLGESPYFIAHHVGMKISEGDRSSIYMIGTFCFLY